jgi:hypothetical protein
MSLTKVTYSMIDSAPVNVLDYGAKGDGTTDDSLAIQAALNATAGTGQSVLIPKTTNGTYVVGQQTGQLYCLNVPSNTRLIIEPGVIIQAKSGIGLVVRILSIQSSSNVYISGYGAVITGIKSEYTTDEQRHGVIVSGSSNVYIEGLTSKDTGGDGFYLGAPTVENVTLVDCVADNNRRNGVSITSGKRIVLERCQFINQNGTAPESGIDIEPNANTDFMEDITLRDCYAYNNAGAGYIVAPRALPGATAKTINVNILNCVDDGGTALGGFNVEKLDVGANKLSGEIVFDNCVSRNAREGSFRVRNYDSNGVPIVFNKCSSINPTRNGVVVAQRVNAPFSVYNESADTGAATNGNVHIYDPIIQYTDTPPNVSDFNFGGLAILVTDCYVDSPIEVGHPGNANKAYQLRLSNSTNIKVNDPREFYTHLGTEVFDPNQAGTTFKNDGAAATFTLGNRAVGYPDQTFEVTNAGGITITPDAGSAIQPLGTTGQSAQSTQVGASLVIRRDSATTWRIVKQVGTWTAV